MGLPYDELPGLNARLLEEHYKIYLGYQKRWKTNDKTLRSEGRDMDRYRYGRLVGEQGFLDNAIILHDLYFSNLTPDGSGDPEILIPPQELENILGDMHYLALSSTGWVILGVSIPRGPLELITMSDHGTGFTAHFWPLLVLDCYEHAYGPQYGINKEGYLEAFFKNVNWDEVQKRSEIVLAMKDAAS